MIRRLACLSFFLMILYFFGTLGAQGCCDLEAPQSQLMKDLLIVDYWNKRNAIRMPTYYNQLLQGGYFSMPSARMGDEGELGFGYGYSHPYIIWSGRCQLIDRLEITGNYRIFTGIADPILTPDGFGDMSDKGANIKFAPLLPEDSQYRLPGIAIGFDDIMGTRSFKAGYVVATQVFIDYDFEFSFGYGWQRYRGLFGGVTWLPFRRQCVLPWIENLALVAEYDAIDYKSKKHEPHPEGRCQKTPINVGLKYRLWDTIDFSISSLRGKYLAGSISASYNFGFTKGFLPKIDEVLPYHSPVDYEPIGDRRPAPWFATELALVLKDQGFRLLDAALYYDECKNQCVRIRITNERYREEWMVRQRLSYLLAALVPEDIETVIVVIDAEGVISHEYNIPVAFLRRYGDGCICEQEFAIMAPMREATPLPCLTYTNIYTGMLSPYCFGVLPKTNTLFGSAKGKLRYSVGVNAFVDGFIYDEIYYNVILGMTVIDDLHRVTGVDKLNPSQIINVRSDIVRYYNRPGITCDVAYLQKMWNFGNSWFGRAAIGLFEVEYGGAALELLYYPVNSCWAVGFEGACLRKRTLSGIGFSDKVRKLNGYEITYRGFLGSQGFVNLYYDWKEANLDLRLKIGKFLANDVGIRYEVSRYFPSGLKVSFWYTMTSAKDYINGQRYYDKGVFISMPLDIFYTCYSRNRWGYGMSAWLRDVGVIGGAGDGLYDTLYDVRSN